MLETSPMKSLPGKAAVRWRRAFSLVEVVLALGIVSFAMVGILGMVPVGLASFRNAKNFTVESTIVQEVAGELQRAEFSSLAAANLYFDEQGLRVESASDPSVLYTVEVKAPQPLDAGSLVAPGAAATVGINISKRSEPAKTSRYAVILPRTL